MPGRAAIYNSWCLALILVFPPSPPFISERATCPSRTGANRTVCWPGISTLPSSSTPRLSTFHADAAISHRVSWSNTSFISHMATDEPIAQEKSATEKKEEEHNRETRSEGIMDF